MLKRSVTVLAPAKLNLSLDVVGTLPNGYHDLDMVMQTIDLYEKITLRRSNTLSLTLPGSFVPVNDKNTAIKAAVAFFRYTGLLAGVDMTIYKRVPVRAGMAGGSADAAGVLVGLSELYDAHLSMSELCAIGAGIGADVPFALLGGTMQRFSGLLTQGGITQSLYLPVLKTVGVAVVVRIMSALCRDSGQSALAAKLEIMGAILALSMCLPLLEQVLELVADWTI